MVSLDEKTVLDFTFGIWCIIFVIVALGIVGNIINLIIFAHNGFQDTVNISLFALAVGDLCSILPLIWTGILVIFFFFHKDVSFKCLDVQYLVGSWPHSCFTRLTSWITAYIMFERCLCIAWPLKVKMILTPTRVKCIILGIYFFMFMSVAPIYYAFSLGWALDPALNRTVLGLRQTDDAQVISDVTSVLVNFVSTIFSFGITASCTFIIIILLNLKSLWRQNTAAAGIDQTRLSLRQRKAVKLVTTVSIVFLVTNSTSVFLVLFTVLNEDFKLFGRLHDLFYMTYSINFMMEAVNSSCGIIIYCTMNEGFRRTLKEIFMCRLKQK